MVLQHRDAESMVLPADDRDMSNWGTVMWVWDCSSDEFGMLVFDAERQLQRNGMLFSRSSSGPLSGFLPI